MSERARATSVEHERSVDAEPASALVIPLERRRAIGTGPRAAPSSLATPSSGRAIQLFADAVGAGLHEPQDAHEIAARGTAGSGSSLPFLEAIQRSFGKHDVSGIAAHVGGAAREASAALGARAYASGDAVAFASAPDLHLAAHEAAHIVQQRGGVRLAGGIGAVGDVYEHHADAVADLVVRGESAESLLDQYAHRGAAGGAAVQRVAETRAALTVDVQHILSIADADHVIAQLEALRTGMHGPASEGSIMINGESHTLANRDLPFVLGQARARRAQLERALARVPPSPQAALRAAVQHARDVAGLEAARAALMGLRATPTSPVPVPLDGTTYAVAPADVEPLLGWIDARISEVQRIPLAPESLAVTERVAPVAPAPSAASADEPLPVGFQVTAQFPREWRIPTEVGELRFEVGVEIAEHATTAAPGVSDRVSVETATRPGDLATGPNGSLGVTGGVRTAIEEVIGRRFATPIRDRIRVESRNGLARGSLGFDFGTADMGIAEIGFRWNAIQVMETIRGIEAETSFEFPITSHWWDAGNGVRARIRGRVVLAPHISAIVTMINRLRAAESTAVAVGGATTGDAAATGAGAVVAEETFGGALAAAGAVGMEVMGPIALVGLIATGVVGLAMVGLILADVGSRPPRRRGPRGPGPMSESTSDEHYTMYGTALHDRVRAFCSAYSATMRGTPHRATGEGGRAGAQAANDRLALLQSEFSLSDIRAAARSAIDLDAQVLAAAREGFQAQVDTTVQASAAGRDDPQRVQRLEWATRYLRSCISLDAVVAPAPVFEYDPCRAPTTSTPGGEQMDGYGATVDTESCPPGASDPDAPNPASGTDSAHVPQTIPWG